MSERIALNVPAPEISLADHRGEPFRLSRLRGERHALLVFDRGFF